VEVVDRTQVVDGEVGVGQKRGVVRAVEGAGRPLLGVDLVAGCLESALYWDRLSFALIIADGLLVPRYGAQRLRF